MVVRQDNVEKKVTWLTMIILVAILFSSFVNLLMWNRYTASIDNLNQLIIDQNTTIQTVSDMCNRPTSTIPYTESDDGEISDYRFTQYSQEYAEFIRTVGPLLREYPEMIQFLMLFQVSENSDLIMIPSNRLDNLIPLPD